MAVDTYPHPNLSNTPPQIMYFYFQPTLPNYYNPPNLQNVGILPTPLLLHPPYN